MDTGRLGVGIIGMGGIGTMHARALKDLEHLTTLMAFSGGTPDAAAEAGWPTAEQLTAQQVIEHPQVQLVAICSPSGTHASLALAALHAGRHVFVEKPLAVQVTDAVRVAQVARERNLTVSMVSQRRFEPEYQHLKRLLDQGALGEIRLASTHVHWHRDDDYYAAAAWRTSMEQGGGSLMNQGVHNVDLLQWLCGPVESVTAQYGTLAHAMDAEDTTVATVRFAGGALGLISTSTAIPPGEPATITVHGAAGVVELGQGAVVRWPHGIPAPDQSSASIASGAADPLAIGHLGHRKQWQNVVAAIRGRSALAVDLDEAEATVRLLCAIYEAAETGKVVQPASLS